LANKLIKTNARLDNTEETTRCIDIRKLPFKYKQNDFTVNIWDFGGQVIYHATHQFFLTKRSVYIFVWEVRREEEELQGFSYWLNIIRLLSNNSPVIIVLNKIDERCKEINQAVYKTEFGIIVDFKKVSCKSGEGINDLLELIKKELLKLPHIGTIWPEVWTKIRVKLESDQRDYINHSEYLNICQEFGLNNDKADYLSEFLHDLGVILHFQDDIILRNIVILKPEWGTNAVYRVLDAKGVQKNNGQFNIKDLDDIWGDSKYPREKFPELLQLMIKFELCFNLQGTQDYIIPELLSPKKPPCNWNNEQNLRFEYHYKFMPAGIISRFIVRQHQRIEGNCYWKNGVILKYEGARALIESDTLQRKLIIRIGGIDKTGLLAIIRSEINSIHETLNHPEVQEMVPCICSQCIEAQKPFFFEYETLKRFVAKNRRTAPCNSSAEDISIEQLIIGIEQTSIADTRYSDRITINVGSLVINNYHELKRIIEEHAPLEEKDELRKSLEILNQPDEDETKKAKAVNFLKKFSLELVNAGKQVAADVISEAIKKSVGL
jgi:internalin A